MISKQVVRLLKLEIQNMKYNDFLFMRLAILRKLGDCRLRQDYREYKALVGARMRNFL